MDNKEVARSLVRRALERQVARSTDQAESPMMLPVSAYIDPYRYRHEVDRIFKRLPLARADVEAEARDEDHARCNHRATEVIEMDDPAQETYDRIMEELRVATRASRTTLRLDLPGRNYPVVAEACSPGVVSIKHDESIDQRNARTVKWITREGRILVSFDRSTLPNFLSDHLQAGHHSPGIFLIRRGATLREVVDFLLLATSASEPWEWEDRCQFIPI